MVHGSQQADVCIICALEKEAHAVERVIGECCQVAFIARTTDDGHVAYRSTIITNAKGELLTLVVLCQTRPGPISAARDVGTLLEKFQPRFVGMSGICAGDKRQVHLGDLVVAEHAYHFEEGKVTRDEQGMLLHQPEGITYGPSVQMLQYVRAFGGWKTPVTELKKHLFGSDESPRCVTALMASGMAVRSDDPFPVVQRQHRRTWALDMEAASLYFALRALPHLDGLVVKGVVDYADLSKDDTFHDFAARASAIYLLTFIQEYVRPVNWKETPFGHLQAFPIGEHPVTGRQWHRQDEAFTDIAQGIRKVVDELRASQSKERPPQSAPTPLAISEQQFDPQNQDNNPTLRSSPFLFNQVLSNPKEFYGRGRERETVLNRTWNAASTSIVGPRRIGKTWLMHYLRLVASQELGSKYTIGYLDAMAAHCSTVSSFVTATLKALELQYRPLVTAQDSLILLEQAVAEMSSKQHIPVLCIDEFESFSGHGEFDLDFFSSLRSMTQIGLCLLVSSKTPLINVVGEPGKTSGFANVFEQITLKPFNYKEAERFVWEKGEHAGLTTQECDQLLLYGQYKGAYWPISLQLAGTKLVEDKTLAEREQDPDYYRPTEQTYWDEFADRLQEIYQGIIK